MTVKLHDWQLTYPEAAACPVWGTAARQTREAGHYFSPRAGGPFILGEQASAALSRALGAGRGAADEPLRPEGLRLALTNVVVEHALRGEQAELTEAVITQAAHAAAADPRRATGAALSVRERGDRLLLLLESLSRSLSEAVTLDDGARDLALAWSATRDRESLWFVLQDLERRSCIDLASRISESGPERVATLQKEGLARLQALHQVLRPTPQTTTLYAALWRGGESGALFEQAIAPAAAAAGLHAVRLDREAAGNRPAGESLAAIRSARIVAVDLTGAPKEMAPGGLWFEAGFAAGLGLPVVWSCKNEAKLHKALEMEDRTGPAGMLFWRKPADLKEPLAARLAQILSGAKDTESEEKDGAA